jgi:hypothetical protein
MPPSLLVSYKFVILCIYYNKLSNAASFTYGNILLLYCVFNKDKSTPPLPDADDQNKDLNRDGYLPNYIIGRIKLCIETFGIIMNSKPDKFHTSILIISTDSHVKEIKEKLIAGGILEQCLEYDTSSKNIESAFNNVIARITKLVNPPCIYFIGSVWQKEIFDSIVDSKLKQHKVIFEGALDDRPYDVVQKEKAVEAPKKGTVYYKRKMTNKAIDALLNYIFPKNKNKTS